MDEKALNVQDKNDDADGWRGGWRNVVSGGDNNGLSIP
jgi:hypothetical protein